MATTLDTRPLHWPAKEGEIDLFSDEEFRDAFALLLPLVVEMIDKPEFPVLVKFLPMRGAASLSKPYPRSRRNEGRILQRRGWLGDRSWVLL